MTSGKMWGSKGARLPPTTGLLSPHSQGNPPKGTRTPKVKQWQALWLPLALPILLQQRFPLHTLWEPGSKGSNSYLQPPSSSAFSLSAHRGLWDSAPKPPATSVPSGPGSFLSIGILRLHGRRSPRKLSLSFHHPPSPQPHKIQPPFFSKTKVTMLGMGKVEMT